MLRGFNVEPPGNTEISVIIADDHTLVREGISLLLTRSPYIRLQGEAEDGKAAVEQVRDTAPDIIIMDISMPKLNGIDAIGMITRESPKTRVIVLTMHKEKRFINGAIQAGARGYILKDSVSTELEMAINSVFSGGYFLSPQITDIVLNSFNGGVESFSAGRPAKELSGREREILQLLAEGESTKEIGDKLHISARTVDVHRRNIMKKTGIKKPIGLVKYAIREGIVQLDTWLLDGSD